MELLFIGIVGLMFLSGKKQPGTQKLPTTTVYVDKGDCWNCLYRSLLDLSDDRTISVFENLMSYVAKYNRLTGKNFQIFETRRALERQKRLVSGGKSYVNLDFAPHVQGRAVDIVEKQVNVWVWNTQDLKDLNTWLSVNFPQWNLLRTGADFKNFNDYPHYEIKRSIWESWQ